MKKLITILTLFLLFINTAFSAELNVVKKDYKVVTKDGFSVVATLIHPKVKNKKEYKTVVLLHSLGYNSEWWDKLPEDLLSNGYAILTIDFRGHGKSVYNSKLARVSWKSLTNAGFKKYPDDIADVINFVKTDNKKIFFQDWAMVGADIGACSGIIAANKLKFRPQTIVMLSPVVSTHGLFAPVALAELSKVDILSIVGEGDNAAIEAQEYLSKFAQATYVTYTSESKSIGMILLKNDRSLADFITSWIAGYLN